MAGAEVNKPKQYLLGQLTEAEEEQFEIRLLNDSDFAEESDIVADEITDDYISGKFEGDELEQVERYFFKSPERRDKLKFALALKARKRAKNSYQYWKFPSYLAIAASVLVVVGAGSVVWRVFFYQNDLNKGLVALRSAFSKERPLEARLADFTYAPLSNVRGGPAKVDSLQRDLAASLLLKEVSENPSAKSHHALGQYYLAERKFDQAIGQLKEALKLDPTNARIYSDLGAALMEKGNAHGAEPGQGKTSEAFAESLDQLNKALELDSSLLEAYFNRALLYHYMRASREAEASWREYLKRDTDSSWADEARRNLKLLEENGRRTSEWNTDEALKDFQEARRAGDDNAAWKALSQSHTSAGNTVTNDLIDSLLAPEAESITPEPALRSLSYVANLELSKVGDRYTSDLLNNYEQETPRRRQVLADARRHMKAAYALFTQLKMNEAVSEYAAADHDYEMAGDSTERIFVAYRLAHCYLFLPKLYQADVAFKRLLAICENNNYRWLLTQCLYGLAHFSFNNSEYSKAIEYSGRALSSSEQLGDIKGVLKCLTQLADINQALNRIDRSLDYLSRGLKLADEEQADPMQRWGVLVQMAFSMSSRQRHAAALVYQKEALNIAMEMSSPLFMTRSYGYLGSAYAAVKMYPEAVSAATNALETGKGMADLEIMANASQQLGDIYREASECDKAIAAYDRSSELYGSLNIDYYSYASHKGKLLCLMTGSDDRTAGEELEKVLDLSKQYRSKITVESERLSFFDIEQRVYDLGIYYEFVRMKNPFKAFDYSEGSRARSLLDEVRRPAKVLTKSYGPDINMPDVTDSMSLAEIKEKLHADTQILQYAVLDDRILMWVVTNSEIHSEEVGVRAEQLNEKVRSYLEEVNRPPNGNSARHTNQAEDLYRILIAPVEPFLDKSKFLCIVADKILHYLPYNALISPASGRYLIEDYDTGTAPSSSLFIYLTGSAERKAGALEEKLLIVGDPHFSQSDFDSLTRLPSAGSEAQAIAGFYHKPRVLLGDEATETTLIAEIEKVEVVHLAMHYTLNSKSEMLSGFPLTPESSGSTTGKSTNGFLQAYEIYGLNLSLSRLVVLSACQTGIEQQYAGEGAVSAARPFLVAGVPIVVASLWPVDSDASAELMANFHKHRIRNPLPVTRALRRTQIEMAHGQDLRYRHPYYWAPFIAIGGRSWY